MVGTNAFGIPDRTYGPTTETVPVADPNSYPNMAAAYPVTDPVSVMETAQMLGSDPALQAGDDFFGDDDVSGDYSQALADAGMAAVPTVEKSFNLSDYLPDFSTLDKIGIDPILGLLDLEQGGETREKQKTIEDLAEHGLITGEEADQYKTDTWMNDLSYSTPKSLAAAAGLALGAIPLQMLDEMSLPAGYKAGMANIRGLTETPNTQLDAVIDLVNLGVLSRQDVKDSIPDLVGMAAATQPASAASVDAPSVYTSYDDIATVPAAPAKPAGPTRAELKAAAAAQRKADLARQKAAARRAKIARQALKDSQAAAARAAAASAAQAKSAQKAAKAVLARMSSDRNAPSQAEINAAIEVMSQVDTFGGGSIGFDGGGFDPQGGETGSSGMGAWT